MSLHRGSICQLRSAVTVFDGATSGRAEIPAGVLVEVLGPVNGVPSGCIEVQTYWPENVLRTFSVPEHQLEFSGVVQGPVRKPIG